MKRVLVIGSPGAGKSTFARALAQRSGLPLIHLDAHYHLPGWTEPDPADWDAKLDTLLAGDSWIIDGNYGGSMDRRLALADTAILLDYPTLLCLWRLVKRITTLHGTVRPDAPPGCPERFDLEFLHYVAVFRRVKTPVLERRLGAFPGRIARFRRPSEAQAFLDALA
ncbi:AAA family ATPase [Qipengyuania sp. RANM35]|uniref:AAA family ATPase n=1 Tax=Qipengyuania sp. RANM35 TaxID=3068635 RepID=UPI0034DB53C5